MSVKHGLLALLERGSRYGYQLRSEFEVATGGTWPLNLPGFPPQSGAATDRRVAIVDFLDDLDAVGSATRARLRDYEGRGWRLVSPKRPWTLV